MKKNICLFFFSLLISNVSLAIDMNSGMNQAVSMPTDEEIMQTLDKFDFTEEQKKQLFKETKKELEKIYSSKNVAELIENLNILPEIQKTDRSLDVEPPKLKSNPKKYANHPPLIKRSK